MIYDQFLLIIESQTISDAVNFFEAFKILWKRYKIVHKSTLKLNLVEKV